MDIGRGGGMGFMEATVAAMAVTLVLCSFLGVLTTISVDPGNPADSLDPEGFSATIESGALVPGFGNYITGFVDSRGLRGATVDVVVPGSFNEPSEVFSVGDMHGALFSRSIPGTVTDDMGRTLPAVYEVVLCV